MNLLSNAFKFTPDGGSISLSLWTEGDTYGFTVRDSGIGMSPEQLTRIFERFYQVDGQRKGTGIGLSLVKMLVEKHHGTITVASEPAQYTEFKVTLPADITAFTEKERELPAHEVETSASFRELPVADEYFSGDASVIVSEELSDDDQIEADSEEGRPTILLVDDNKEMVDYLKDNFRQNYVTLTAGNGEEALAIMKEHRVDIVLSDVMMPGIDGFQVCKELRSRNGGIGIIMLSAKTQEMDKVTGLMLGADDYVSKPFSPSELLARVDSLYRRVALAQSHAENNFKEELKSGEFTLNLRNRALMKNGKMIELTQVEFQIMEYFFSNPGTALDRMDILNHVWGDAYVGEDKIVDVNIRRLRMKVEDEPSNPKYIITVWGLGYKWNA